MAISRRSFLAALPAAGLAGAAGPAFAAPEAALADAMPMSVAAQRVTMPPSAKAPPALTPGLLRLNLDGRDLLVDTSDVPQVRDRVDTYTADDGTVHVDAWREICPDQGAEYLIVDHNGALLATELVNGELTKWDGPGDRCGWRSGGGVASFKVTVLGRVVAGSGTA